MDEILKRIRLVAALIVMVAATQNEAVAAGMEPVPCSCEQAGFSFAILATQCGSECPMLTLCIYNPGSDTWDYGGYCYPAPTTGCTQVLQSEWCD